MGTSLPGPPQAKKNWPFNVVLRRLQEILKYLWPRRSRMIRPELRNHILNVIQNWIDPPRPPPTPIGRYPANPIGRYSATTPTVTTVTAVGIPKKVIMLMWSGLLPPPAEGQHRASKNTTLAGRMTPRVILADMYDPQSLASAPKRPLEVHRRPCELTAKLGLC